jgi:hypothetical protein
LDEAAIINIEQYNQEVAPGNRGNREHFGKVPIHHGFKYSTSMPQTKSGKWILEYADYYEKEAGVKLFEVWNRVVALQLELIDIDNPKQFAECWNEIERVRMKIAPFLSKDRILCTVSNAFDNLQAVGIRYFRDNKKRFPYLVFMTEFMNYLFDKVEGCFYAIDDQKHIYRTGLDDNLLKQIAKDTNYNIDILMAQTSRYDRDCNPALPLEIVPDWGSSINLFCVGQERNYDFVNGITTTQPCFNFINEFYVKPDGKSNILINQLCSDFSEYYKNHTNRHLLYYRDRYGDRKNPNVVNHKSYNQQAIERLEQLGWEVEEIVHKGNEPPQSDKYLLWGDLLSEEKDTLPKIRFNGEKCKFTLISMNNAKVKDVDNQLVKNKSSERNTSGVPAEEATHFSDAADKIVWTKYNEYANNTVWEDFTRW